MEKIYKKFSGMNMLDGPINHHTYMTLYNAKKKRLGYFNELVECDICNKQITRSNMSRHKKLKHINQKL